MHHVKNDYAIFTSCPFPLNLTSWKTFGNIGMPLSPVNLKYTYRRDKTGKV